MIESENDAMNQTLYAIIDPSHADGDDRAIDITRAILRGGASFVQLRDKTSTTRQMLRLGKRLQVVCDEFGATFIVNDRFDVALACGADGVHLGPDDLPVEAARAVVDDEFIIGASAGTVEVARQLAAEGADYLGVGAIFEARESKPDASAPRGPQIIQAVTKAVDIPVVGIGGITADNAADVIAAGASGVAVIRSLMAADDPEVAAKKMVRRLRPT